uniref:Nucleoside-triphosphatase ENP88_01960 n=1 Tax=Archaeoglobus fulgidus TaxID=2234 RepID=A0A7J2TIA3_ARCFL
MRIAITGRPGIGKTTLCLKVYESLKNKIKISGFITLEERSEGKRVGFKLVDLNSKEEAKLARVGKGKVNVGKYEVLIESFENFLRKLKLDGDLIIIDEIGPMELKSEKFVSIVNDLLSKENLLFTIHYRFNHPLLNRIRKNFSIYIIDEKNRDAVAEEIVKNYARN